jgi:cytochrome c-type biogenesis protein CcmH
MRRAAALAAAAVTLLLTPPATAAAQCPRTSLGDIEDEVMCPVCGTPLGLATDAPQAEIKPALAAQFGDAVLALPGDAEDDDLGDVLVYVVPALGIALAAGGIAFAVVRWRRARRPGDRQASGAGDGQRRLDADMERYEL